RQNVASAEAVADNERTTRLTVSLNVRTFYFAARANKALMQVAKDTLTNQQKHLDQVNGFVKVGTQPEIALAQQRTAVANAQVQLINAENNYLVAKARPDYLSLEKQVEAQRLAIWAAKTAYGPNLQASTTFSDAGNIDAANQL